MDQTQEAVCVISGELKGCMLKGVVSSARDAP